jgi:hypothetical protein
MVGPLQGLEPMEPVLEDEILLLDDPVSSVLLSMACHLLSYLFEFEFFEENE